MANNQDSSFFPRLDLQLNSNSIDELLKVLQVVRPSWFSLNVKFEIFSDGITNNLIRVNAGPKPEDSVLIRIYGKNTDKIINREQEVMLLKVLEQSKLGPKVYATFLNGIVYQYFPGRTLSQQYFYSEHIYPLVAQEVAKLHKKVENCSPVYLHPNQTVIWDKIELFMNHSSDYPSTRPYKNQFFRYDGSIDYEINIPSKADLWEEVSWLRKAVENLGSLIVLCHNDLLLANILYDEKNCLVRLIDFEYAGPNYQAYDLANHFNEYAFGVDFFDSSLYPTKEFQRKWLRYYLKSFNNQKKEVHEDVVSKFLDQIKWFRLVSHMFCGTWALFQIAHSALVFDFHGYAHCRLHEYFKLKKVVGA